MKLQVSLVFLCLLICQSKITKARPPPPLSYSIIQFVQTWAPTYCKGQTSACIDNPGMRFYIHGLWPAKSSGESLRNCHGPHEFLTVKTLEPKVKDIMTDLEENWRTLMRRSTNLGFWVEEWRKHGVCSTPTISRPEDYFKKGLKAEENADLLGNLMRGGIAPGETPYSKDQIEAAIRNGIHSGSSITIYITCKKVGMDVYLKEIYLCMDVYAAKFIPCPAKADNSICGNSQERIIHFPRS